MKIEKIEKLQNRYVQQRPMSYCSDGMSSYLQDTEIMAESGFANFESEFSYLEVGIYRRTRDANFTAFLSRLLIRTSSTASLLSSL